MKVFNNQNSGNGRISLELRAAAASASLAGFGSTKQLRIGNSDLPSLVPSGARVKIKAVRIKGLKMGDVVCVNMGQTFALRRFVKTRIGSKDTYLLVAHEGFGKKEAITRGSLLGRVEQVKSAQGTYDPNKLESVWQKFWGKLTEFGTHKPFGLFSA